MTNLLGAAWHKSNLNEYLAQCFLSALGVSAPVIRQEDIGIDFYCALSKEENKRLTFHSPFAVQCGSGEKEFLYGGFDPKNGRWRVESRDWLFEQELPLFVCVTDVATARVRLYSTSAKWLVRDTFGHEKMAAIELMPDAVFDPIRNVPQEWIQAPTELHSGKKYGVPLRHPIVDLQWPDLTEATTLQGARDALAIAIEIERRNITSNHHLKVFFTEWITDTTSNTPKSLKTAWSICTNSNPGAHGGPIDALRKPALVLAMNLKAQNKTVDIEKLAPLFGLFDPATFNNDWFDHLPQSVVDAWLRQKSVGNK